MHSSRETVELTVWTAHTFTFPNGHADRCSAHGQYLCVMCARNPGDCASGGGGSCSTYASTGMHWDTCPNRIKTALPNTPEPMSLPKARPVGGRFVTPGEVWDRQQAEYPRETPEEKAERKDWDGASVERKDWNE